MLDLHVARVGRPGALRSVGSNGVSAGASKVRIDRGLGVIEWFAHDSRGLEHGFEIESKPDGDGDLVVVIAVDGLVPTMSTSGAIVELRDTDRRTKLTYEQATALDADGTAVAVVLDVRDGAIELHVLDADAKYPISIDPLVVGQQQTELLASDGTANDYFGTSSAIDGATIVVGAGSKASISGVFSGAAYVFARSGSTWTPQQEILPPDANASSFGAAVAIKGGIVVVGADSSTVGSNADQGTAYVYAANGSTWTKQAQLLANDGQASDQFGSSVAATTISGAPYAIVGAMFGSVAYVFASNGATWTQQAELLGSNDYFGSSVAINGTTAVVGASGGSAAYVYTQSGATWTRQQKLVPTGGAANDSFGSSVAFDGTTVIVGALYTAVGSSENQGSAYIFTQSGSTWTQQQKLIASDGATNALFGSSVAIGGTTAIVGAFQMTVGTHLDHGAAYVFTRTGSTWTQEQELLAADGGANDQFGFSASMSGTTAVIGASGKAVGAQGDQGAAYVFIAAHTAGDSCTAATDCNSGFCVDGACCSTASCDTCGTCNGSTPGTCTPKSRDAAPTSTCAGGYLCDGLTMSCATACATNLDCATGYTCDLTTNHCAQGARCTTDGTGSIGKSGTAQSCAPYLCDTTGACKTACSTTADCAIGNVCNVAESPSQCIVSATPSSGGCRVTKLAPGHDVEGSPYVGALIVIAMRCRSSRRRRTLGQSSRS
ncbi:MAG: hypothetical protein ACHREM_11860 [Polyangiales bacterium]